MEKVPMTAGGLSALEEELRRLKFTERHEVIKAIEVAREHGDLSENAEYARNPDSGDGMTKQSLFA